MNKDDTNTKTNTDNTIEQDKQQDAPMSLRAIIREQATEDDMPLTKNITLRKILGGDILSTDIIRKQIWLILIVVLFIVVYISNRYKCQQDLILIDNLTEQLKDAKYRTLSSSSDLTQKTRESKVLEQLRASSDSTLHIATQPPYIINVSNTEQK
ncbi:FtsL-like putative cell division protein [uncultured Prevotella sp.]|uniref:FtsL-like putative cell division protein n=1 Tax=uncultured Prevotella sp. TaxID=159272 RepID=UPI0026775A9C|nr:FtsL-like putative cell division protein [uncultured Prevotella sp.]